MYFFYASFGSAVCVYCERVGMGGTGVKVLIIIDVALGRGVKVIVGVQVGGNLNGVIPCVGAKVREVFAVLHPARSIMNSKEIYRILSFTFTLNT